MSDTRRERDGKSGGKGNVTHGETDEKSKIKIEIVESHCVLNTVESVF